MNIAFRTTGSVVVATCMLAVSPIATHADDPVLQPDEPSELSTRGDELDEGASEFAMPSLSQSRKEPGEVNRPIEIERDKFEEDSPIGDPRDFDAQRELNTKQQPVDTSPLVVPPASPDDSENTEIDDAFRERLIGAFDGDFQWLLSEEHLSKPVMAQKKRAVVEYITVSSDDRDSFRRQEPAQQSRLGMNLANGLPGSTTTQVPRTRYVHETLTIDPKSKALQAEQIHALLRTLLDAEIRTSSSTIGRFEDKERQQTLLRKIRYQYEMRFLVDTAYLEHVVRKVETRVSKLRGDIDARDSSMENWVNAMSTLAEMRSNGIETMSEDVRQSESSGVMYSYPMPSPAIPTAMRPATTKPADSFQPPQRISLPNTNDRRYGSVDNIDERSPTTFAAPPTEDQRRLDSSDSLRNDPRFSRDPNGFQPAP